MMRWQIMESPVLTKSECKRFALDEDGAITVDWVVLTAGVAGLVIAVSLVVGNGASDNADNVASVMSDRGLGSY
jgi:Flp pilus assembly pilin Flp